MGLFDNLRNRIVDYVSGIIGDAYSARVTDMLDKRAYRVGIQRQFIKVRPSQTNDNLVVNFLGLAIDRSLSMLFGAGVEFSYEDETQEEFIDEVWTHNKKELLLHRIGLYGAEDGTAFVKIVPLEEGYRLVALDPALMDIKTAPDDFDQVVSYTIQYKTTDENGNPISKKEVTERTQGGWSITRYIDKGSGKWQQDGTAEAWQHEYPPIHHCQNLPAIGDVWGIPDVTDDTIQLQDRLNFTASNISKIIRLYAHPQRYGVMAGKADSMELGPDQMPSFSSPEAKIMQLEPAGDLASSYQFMLGMRQAIFDITRTVDISSMADKIGALTNFGLHVLYQDALSKLDTKRALYGEFLQEINRRLLDLAGLPVDDCEIAWGDPLPENQTEETALIQADIGLGILDKQTAAEMRGYDWEQIQERMTEQEEASNQNNANLGALLLQNFERGGVPR